MGGQHIGDAVLGAPVPGNDQTNALLPSQQSDMVGCFAGDKAVRAHVDGFLQVAAARTADFSQTGDGAVTIDVPHAAMQRIRTVAGQLLYGSGLHRADTAAILGEIAAALPLHT